MKSRLQAIIIALLFSSSVFSQAPLAKRWDYTYGGGDDETFTSIIQANDSGFLMGGFTRSDSSGNVSQPTRGGTDFWIVKTDSLGIKQWDKRFGGSFEDRLYSMDKTSDGGYILGGYTTSDSSGDVTQPTHGSMDFWMVKIDSVGHKLWDKRFGGASYDQLSSIQQCTDKGFILGGWTFSDSTGDVTQHTRGGEDFWIIKTDSFGNKLWDKRFGGDQTEELSIVMQIANGGFILGGATMSDSSGDVTQVTRGNNDMWLVKLNSSGNKIWDRRFGGSGGEGVSSIIQTPDKGFLISGGTGSDTSGDVTQIPRDTSSTGTLWGDIWTVKIDSSGNKQWDKRFGGSWSDGASGDITRTSDRGYLIGGTSLSGVSGDKSENNFGHKQSWIIKTDSTGAKVWDKTIFTLGEDQGTNVIQTTDGCYLVCNNSHAGIGAYKTDTSRGSDDFWMVKFCETEVPQLPVATFSVNFPGLCSGGCFDFINTSINASTFIWNFTGGNPATSTAISPTNVCFSTPGNYDVTLYAINSTDSDTLVQPGIVHVFSLPNVTITQHNDTLSVPQGYTFYQWFRNNIAIINDTNYFHVLTQNGNYSILVIDTNSCPGQDTLYSVILNITAFNEINNDVNIFPNPAQTEIKINMPGNVSGGKLFIRDIYGREIYSDNVRSFPQHVSVSQFPVGIYFLEIYSGNEKYVTRFIKQ